MVSSKFSSGNCYPWWEKDPEASHAEGMNDEVESIFDFHEVPATFDWVSMPDNDAFWVQ